MNYIKNNPSTNHPKPTNLQTIYIISDQSTDLSSLYSTFRIEALEDEGTCLRLEIFTLLGTPKHF
jgi:hypothetical protein